MNLKSIFALWLWGVSLLAARGVEMVFQPVALSGQLAPGLTNNIKFNSFEYVSLADDGRIAFTAIPEGPGVTSTNNRGLWAGLPGDLNLLARTGDADSDGNRLTSLWKPNIDNHQAVGFVATEDICTNCAHAYFGVLLEIASEHFLGTNTLSLPRPVFPKQIPILNPIGGLGADLLGFVVDAVAVRVRLFGPGIDFTSDQAIVAGPRTNVTIVARKGSPAPGLSGNFTFFPTDSGALALMPDGNVAFLAAAEGTSGFSGLWFGKAGAVQAVVLGNRPAPASLLGPGYTFATVAINGSVEVNARGELAFVTYLNGPGLNSTNSAFVVAGPPSAPRVIVRSGQAAPGIPGAVFADFSQVLLGTDGTVAFTGRYTTNGTDYISGLWLAPTNGATSRLLMHGGQRAPGTPAGIYFTNSFPSVQLIETLFMNSRNQVVFRSRLGGPGLDYLDNGIWLAEPDGTVNLIVRRGDVLDIGVGVMARVSGVSFGADPEPIAGPEDGRRTSFNDRGEVALSIGLEAATPPFTGAGAGIFIVQTGIILRAERTGNDIRVKFPTLNGKHYRVEYKTNLNAGSWSVLAASVTGTGGEFIVTDPGVVPSGSRYYQVVRTD